MKEYMMRKRRVNPVQEPLTKNSCRHYWIIEVANGPTSKGVCKYCGETRDFLNVIPDFTVIKRNTHPLGLPEMPEVGLDKNSES